MKHGIFKYTNVGDVTVAMRGQLCYVSDDQTVTEASGDDPIAGVIYDVDSDGVWVEQQYPHPTAVALNPSP